MFFFSRKRMDTEDISPQGDQAEDPASPPSREEAVTDGQAPKKTSLSTESERAAMIASVLRDQAMKESIRALARGPEPKPLFPQLAALAVATVVAVYVWFGSPGWLGPDPVPLPPVQVEMATLRLEMFLQAQAIEHYRDRNGRIPAFLEEVGPPRPGVAYRRLDANTYLLQGQGDRVRLTYSSREPSLGFLTPAGEALLMGAEAQ